MRVSLALAGALALNAGANIVDPSDASTVESCTAPLHLQPIVDARDLAASSDEILGATLQNAGQGVFYLANCGFLCDIMSASSWEEEYGVTLDEFFVAGREDADAVAGGDLSRGFIAKGGESGVVGKFYEVKEGFEYGDAGSTARPNKWGGASDEMVAKLARIFDEMQKLKNAIVAEVLAPYLNDGVELLAARDWVEGKDIDLIRIFNYLECEVRECVNPPRS